MQIWVFRVQIWDDITRVKPSTHRPRRAVSLPIDVLYDVECSRINGGKLILSLVRLCILVIAWL